MPALLQPACKPVPAGALPSHLPLLPPHRKAGNGDGDPEHDLQAHVPLEHEVVHLCTETKTPSFNRIHECIARSCSRYQALSRNAPQVSLTVPSGGSGSAGRARSPAQNNRAEIMSVLGPLRYRRPPQHAMHGMAMLLIVAPWACRLAPDPVKR